MPTRPDQSSSDSLARLGVANVRGRTGWIIALVIAVVVLLIALFFAPRLFALYWLNWGVGFFHRILYEDLGLSDAWSSAAAVVLSFGYALAGAFLMGWTLWRVISWRANARQVAGIFVAYVIVFAAPHVLHAVTETWANPGICFNQRTGESIKWYAVTDGEVVLYDSPGYDKFGNEKKPVSREICQVFDQQQGGRRPQRITADARQVQFFNPTTGVAQVWYSKSANGNISLYSANGFDPGTGQALQPVSADVVAEVKALAEKRAAAAEDEKKKAAAAAEALPAKSAAIAEEVGKKAAEAQKNTAVSTEPKQSFECSGENQVITLDANWRIINPQGRCRVDWGYDPTRTIDLRDSSVNTMLGIKADTYLRYFWTESVRSTDGNQLEFHYRLR